MNRDRRSLLVHALGALALVSVPMALDALVGVAVDARFATGRFPWWFPSLWSTGATLVRYHQLVSLLTYVLVPAGVFLLGYRYGTTRPDAVGE